MFVPENSEYLVKTAPQTRWTESPMIPFPTSMIATTKYLPTNKITLVQTRFADSSLIQYTTPFFAFPFCARGECGEGTTHTVALVSSASPKYDAWAIAQNFVAHAC